MADTAEVSVMTPQDVFRWILDETAASFVSAFEAMAGDRPPEFAVELLATSPAFAGATFGWTQPWKSLVGEIFLASSEEDVIASGHHALLMGGADDASEDEQKSAFLNLIGQVFGKLGLAMSARLDREIAPDGGGQSVNLPEEASWGAIRFTVQSRPVTCFLAIPSALLGLLALEAKPATPISGAIETSLPLSPIPSPNVPAASVPNSHTFDLLLDVELPVSVSFGHAHVPLKDVLKLTTGSIVELSRTVVEPVDVVVNNCVIAKGEVVVVEGNFGVRIQHVVSRSERLRTLQ